MKRLTFLIMLATALCGFCLERTRAQKQKSPDPPETLIRNATVLTIAHGTLQTLSRAGRRCYDSEFAAWLGEFNRWPNDYGQD